MPEISLAPQIIFSIFGFGVSNAMASSFLVTLFLLVFALYCRFTFKLVPGKLQIIVEMLIEFMMEQLEQAFGSRKKAKLFLPWLVTFLIFITLTNQFSLMPFVGQVLVSGSAAFRTATSDLSMTIALAIASVVAAHLMALYARPLGHLANFFPIGALFKARSFTDFFDACLGLFLGFLDIIGEIAKIMSLSFRLFGNIFAGEVIIVIIGSLSIFTSYIVPIPFLALSIFSGFVQAFVFTILSTQFIAATLKDVHNSEDADESLNLQATNLG